MREVPGHPGWQADEKGHVYKNGEEVYGWIAQEYIWVYGYTGSIKRSHLVALAYHGPRNGLEIRHLNDIHTDDRPENLRWGTHTENIQDSIKNGTHYDINQHCIEGGCAPKYSTRGHRHYKATLSDNQVREIRAKRKQGILARELAEEYGVHIQYVYALVSHRKRAEVV